MNFIKKIFIGLAVIICFIFEASVAQAGFGISPPSVTNINLLPGSSDEQIIYIVRSEPNETLSATVEINAGVATNWITIENGNSFEIPKGIQQFPMKVMVRVPANAQLGDYKGTIELVTTSINTTKQTAPVKVNMGAEIVVNLKVTNNELVDYNIQGLSIQDTGKGSPIILAIKIQNKGNAPAGPTKVNAVFYDIYHSIKLWEGQVDISDKAESFSTRDIKVELPNNLDIGQYWADVEFFDGDKSINKNKIVFTIISAAEGAQANKKENSLIAQNSLVIINVVGLILIILLTVLLAILRKNRKNKMPPVPPVIPNSGMPKV